MTNIQKRLINTSLLFVALVFTNIAIAQKTMVNTHDDKDFKKGVLLFNKEKFAAAHEIFDAYVRESSSNTALLKAEAEYYSAICALELFNADAEYLLQKFIEEYSENTKIELAKFAFGKYYYRENKFPEALIQFENVDEKQLSKQERFEFQFKKGYCYYQAKNNEKSRDCFRYVKNDSTNKYKSPALYYYSHLEYLSKNYETAYKGFISLKNDETFAPVVPYYIAQILYIQRKYKDVIDYATPLLEGASVNRVPEIARILAESYYQLGQFERAQTYMEKFFQTSKTISKHDNYLMGYLYYRVSKFGDAAKYFTQVSGENDSLSQNAFYHLADCYIKLNQKEKARNAYSAAAKMDSDKVIKQDAMFSYAKLTFELSRSPFNEAITSFQQYIDTYPDAKNIEEAYSYLVKVYMTTRNYKDALAWLDKISKRDNEMNTAYQKIAYYRGLEYFNNLELDKAIELFDIALKNNVYDKNITALSYYWRADANYRLGNYIEAIDGYKAFVTSPGAIGKSEYQMAHYNLGYAYFKQKKYDDAATWFRTYVELKNVSKSKILTDACNRAADCYFMQKKYDQAIKFYEQAYAANNLDYDYALYQKSFCFGIQKKYDQKIDGMLKLLKDYSQSAFVDDANFQIAETYCTKEQHEKAIPYYETVVQKHPNSSFGKRSLLQLGLIYYNLDQTEKSLAVYKRIVNDYKGSNEAKNALNGIKNIFIGKGDANSYLDYVKSVNGENSVSQYTQDSLIYLAGEDAYMKENCTRSIQLFGDYVRKFRDGIFIINSLYYLADCYSKNKNNDSAAYYYQRIIDQPKNKYTEQSLYYLSNIQFTSGKYKEASLSYVLLDSLAEYKSNQMVARKGALMCFDKLGDSIQVLKWASKLINTEKVSPEDVRYANYSSAKIYYKQQKYDVAKDMLKKVATEVKSPEGAESKYLISNIQFLQGKIDDAEKTILDFLDQNSPQQYWLAKAYLLWAQIFVVKKDNFQATHTLQSIIDNYPEKTDGIVEDCKAMLDKLNTPPATIEPVESQDAEIQIK